MATAGDGEQTLPRRLGNALVFLYVAPVPKTIEQLRSLLATPELPDLGPRARAGTKTVAEIDSTLASLQLPAATRELLRSLLLLWHDHLDASHTLSQGIENADGSFLHAIMHRREPDYWNSKYWWRRVGKHPSFAEISRRGGELLDSSGDEALRRQLLPRGEWDAFAFVDACEAAAEAPASARGRWLRELQRVEAEVLLDYFLRDDAR